MRKNTLTNLNACTPNDSKDQVNEISKLLQSKEKVDKSIVDNVVARRVTGAIKQQLTQKIVSINFFNAECTQARIRYTNGEVYEGQVDKNGDREGRGITFYPSGSVSAAYWSHNTKTEDWPKSSSGGKLQCGAFMGVFVRGKPHGKCTINYPEGHPLYKNY